MDQLLKQLRTNYPKIIFEAGDSFCWSPSQGKVLYVNNPPKDDVSCWALLHELAHAILKHGDYSSDIELLLMEVAAWDEAKKLAKNYDITINNNHIQDCLDTYRDWLHRRSTCPKCKVNTTQQNHEQYTCFNCQTSWRVSSSRFCRPYRMNKTTEAKHDLSKNDSKQKLFV